MAYLEDLYAALRVRILATWPDVAADGIWETEHVDMVPWADLTPPYAVIAAGRMDEGDWGAQNLTYESDIDIYYVGIIAGPSTSIRAKLEALRDDLRATELTAGQVIRLPSIVWDQSLTANQVFASKNYSHRAGMLTARTVIGTIG